MIKDYVLAIKNLAAIDDLRADLGRQGVIPHLLVVFKVGFFWGHVCDRKRTANSFFCIMLISAFGRDGGGQGVCGVESVEPEL